jgi:phosphoserine phosphatase
VADARTAALAAVLLLSGCPAPERKPGAVVSTAPVESSRLLKEPGWAPENRERMEAFIRAHGKDSPGYDPTKAPTVAFDWDMTSIFNDLGDATFYFQIKSLSLKLSPEGLARILPEKYVTTGASLAAERQETLDAYKVLVDAKLVGAGRDFGIPGSTNVHDTRIVHAFDVFRYRMIWFYERLEEVDGPPVAYPWIVKLFAGFTPAEVTRLVERVLSEQLRDPAKMESCAKLKVEHPHGAPPIDIAQGIVASPEMRELYRTLRENGFDVYVVTASFGSVVATLAAAQYGVPDDHVVGIRLATRPDGTFTDEVQLPITYRQGKADNIRKFLPREPILSAGDSDTDVEMLTMPSVQLRLILDRKKKPDSDIGKLYEKARVSDPEHWLIQGRNDYGPDGTALGTWNGTTRTP